MKQCKQIMHLFLLYTFVVPADKPYTYDLGRAKNVLKKGKINCIE